MKMAKRVFVCLMALALCVSLASVFAMADGSDAVSVSEIRKVLEYYNEPVIFDYNFEDGYTTEQLVNVNGYGDTNLLTVVEGEGGKYLEIVGDWMYCAPTYFTWNTDTAIDDFFVDFAASASSSATLGLNTVSLFVDSVAQADVINSTPGTELVSLSFSEGNVKYADSKAIGGIATLKDAEGNIFAISPDIFYNVSVEYMVSDGAYTLTVSQASDPTVSATVTGLELPCTEVAHVRLGGTENNMYDSIIYLDNINATGGSFHRVAADRVVATEKAISDILTLVSGDAELSDEDALELFSIASTLTGEYGFVSENAETVAALENIVKASVEFYAAKLNECLSLVVEDGAYAERLANWEGYAEYNELMPDDISCVGAERQPEIQAIIDAYASEGEKLVSFKENSEGYIAAFAGIDLENAENKENYVYLKGYYDAVAEYTPYAGYEGVAELEETHLALIATYERLATYGKAFVDEVAVAADSERSFGERYTAYITARDNKFENITYPGISEALVAFDAVSLDMEKAIAICEDFLLHMTRAEFSTYLNAKKSALADAARGTDENAAPDAQLVLIQEKYMEYPGIAEAVEKYSEVSEQVSASEAAADRYIAYILELESVYKTLSKAELGERIAEAERLAMTGDITGYEGITEVNIVFNAIKTEYELTAGYKAYFSVLVASLKAENDAVKRAAIMNEALDIAALAESYEGVDAAEKAELDAAVDEYNKKVQALNAAFQTANSVAVDVVSASAGSSADDAQIGRVAALIKKFSELELVPEE